jgi:prepilin-type N-terminal cleavage/methylation domain-containing protein
MKNHKNAFTLVELLLVMAIIGVLSIGAIAGGGFALKRARDTRKKNNVDQIATMMEAYYNDNLAYPSAPTEMSDLLGLDSSFGTGANEGQTLEIYLEGWDFEGEPCQQGGSAMENTDRCYSLDTKTTSYVICTHLEGEALGDVTHTPTGGGDEYTCYCRTGGGGDDVADLADICADAKYAK